MTIRAWTVLLVAAGGLALGGCLDSDSGGSGGNDSTALSGGPPGGGAAPGRSGGAGGPDRGGPPMVPPGIDRQMNIHVLSSAPDQVSGGDVRIAVGGPPGQWKRISLWLNDHPIGAGMLQREGDRLEGVVDGLQEGENTLVLHHEHFGELDRVTLVNYPITGPMFSGPQQYPFVCSTVREWGLQPLVDHDEEWGFPVHDADGALLGYSKDCSVEPFVEFHYMSTDGGYKPMPADGSRPEDLAQTTLLDGRTVDFIVRWERGTINRFLYSIATLAEPGDDPWRPGRDNWNGRLLYHFQGGVGIGHFQGRMDGTRARLPEVLGQGYAVIYSTGNRTGEHYNLQVGGETALMVKEQFIKRFGEPLYTVAIGGSGGGIQQYVYAQNHPGLIDAGVPQYSYPDMVTQVIHVGDCELLEYYMDANALNPAKWQITDNRSWLVGFNATDLRPDPLAEARFALGYDGALGSTECVPAWRGLTPLTLNPHFGQVREQEKMHPPGIMDDVDWTHYDDLRNIYGVDENGNPRTLWDNEGVQYGLQALRDGHITPEEFLHLNWHVGGWKQPSEMVQEGFPFLGEPEDVFAGLIRFDPWSSANMNLAPDAETPAPRTAGDLQAIQAAYTSGLVFDGQLDIPFIDWRHYLEEVLDMHNSHQSFSARQRIINRMGHADNQVIWFTDARPTLVDEDGRGRPQDDFNQTWMALEVIDEWMANIRRHPHRSVAENRPARAVDSCFNTDGSLMAAGDDVWNGILDDYASGACTQAFPLYETSRIVAGGPIEGSVFKCSLQSVEEAIARGVYGSWTPTPEQVETLKQIFPTGVCDYSQPDQGRPAG
ncbi:MAG: hypothetical protein JJT90_10310 [Ectothiorhodospiraceae bacterium]|nr:hypothetical protein [Ectothiorhodospiraceae bacterium]